MNIDTLSIYGYGHLQDLTIELGQPLHVIYGHNEAGKTTIFSFIEAMLFGFPKGQTNELRYEPKTGSVHGGKIELSIKSKGKITIERIRGREPDESTVYFNDKLISETELTHLLNGMDRRLYRNLFSSQLEQLRAMGSLDEATLNQYLLGAGFLGSFSLVELERKLEKSQSNLFKPQGRVPIINKQVMDLQKLQANVENSSGLREKYAEKVAEKQEFEAKLLTFASNKERLQTERQFYEKGTAVAPLFTELKLVQMKQAELPQLEQFPENGIERYERLKMRLLDFRGEIEDLQSKLEGLAHRLPNVTDELLNYEDAVQVKREQAEIYRMKQEGIFRLEAQIKHENEVIAKVLEQVGSEWSSEKIINTDVSLSECERIETLVHDEKDLRAQYTTMEKELASVRSRFKSYELKAKNIQSQLVSNEERKRIEDELSNYDERSIVQEERYIEKIITHLEEQIKRIGKPFSNTFILLFGSISASFAILLLIVGQAFGFLLTTLTGGIISVFLLIMRKQRLRSIHNLHGSKKREEEQLSLITERLSKGANEKRLALMNRLTKDNEQRKEWEMMNQLRRQAQLEYENLSRRYDNLEKEWKIKQADLKQWAGERGFSTTLSGEQLSQQFLQVRSAKQTIRNMREAKNERHELQKWNDHYEENLRQLATKFELDKKNSINVLLRKIEAKLATEKQKLQEKKLIKKQIAEETEKLETLEAKTVQYEEAIDKLFNLAECETEEQFYAYGKVSQQKQALQARHSLLDHQIELHVPNEKERQKLESFLEKETAEFEKHIAEIDQKLSDVTRLENDSFKRLAEIRLALKELIKGGEYDDHLQKYELERSELNKNAKEWAVYTVALDVLQKTKERYREKRLPQTIQFATTFFHLMTEGEYVKIQMPVAGENMTVTSRDGIRYLPKELSRGTQEQLFLSLRFALATVYPASIRYPLLLDDLLIHFDQQRLRAAIEVIREQNKRHQILLFTCHEHIAEKFHKDEVVNFNVENVTRSHI